MQFKAICKDTLKVFLTLSLKLFVKELAQFILNPTNVQYAPPFVTRPVVQFICIMSMLMADTAATVRSFNS